MSERGLEERNRKHKEEIRDVLENEDRGLSRYITAFRKCMEYASLINRRT